MAIKMDQTQEQSIGVTEVGPMPQADRRVGHFIKPSSLLARALICIRWWRKKHPPARGGRLHNGLEAFLDGLDEVLKQHHPHGSL